MKKFLTLFIGFIFSIFLACEQGNDDPDPTCTDGIMNGNETGIDCGGDCDECFDCFSNYCSNLSGAISGQTQTFIHWTVVQADGVPLDSMETEKSSYLKTKDLLFRSNGKFKEFSTPADGEWHFDNSDSPTEITIKWIDSGDRADWSAELLSLTEDTLKLGEVFFANEVVFVPKERWSADN